jgi:hypothetical protein
VRFDFIVDAVERGYLFLTFKGAVVGGGEARVRKVVGEDAAERREGCGKRTDSGERGGGER